MSQSSLPNVDLSELAVVDRHSGLSRAARRRLQNTLNQRRSRQRKKQLSNTITQNGSNQKWIIYTDKRGTGKETSHDSLCYEPPTRAVSQALPAQGRSVSEMTSNDSYFCRLGPTERNAFLVGLRYEVFNGASRHSLRSELLLPVTQYNIILAMHRNAASIGLTADALCHDIPSPFNTQEPWALSLPPSLQPTTTQRKISHHPWIDLFPMASVRDVLLKYQGEYDDEELCHDVFSSCGGQQGQTGMFIWGEPWDPSAYEFSESLIRKWLWLFSNCIGAIQTSNYWRAKRGETRISLMGNRQNRGP